MSLAIRYALVGALMFAMGAQAQNAQPSDAAAAPAAAATAAQAAPTVVAPQTDAPAVASTTQPANDMTVPAAAASASATNQPATAAPTGKVGAPPEGKGQIVFYRPKKFVGAAIGFKVREGDKELGKLRNGDYFILTVDPGKHDYTVHSEAKDTLHMEIEAGETYYVAGSISMGFMVGHPHLAPSDQASFDQVADHLDLVN